MNTTALFVLDGRDNVNWVFSQVPAALELEKFVEDVKNGVYPILSWQANRSDGEPAKIGRASCRERV